MEKVGVEAIVSGLSSFLGDMGKIDKSISGLSGGSSLLGRAFSGLGNIVEWLTGSVFRVLEYTLGSLLSSAIQGVISYVQELITSTIEAGNEFQSLEIRLKNFNFNSAIESGKDYTTAQQEAIDVTREQLEWLQKIAATTPYDLTDIANVYTLARSYGFANEEAQSLTTQISDFAASMGLGNTEITRIIKNFGQMTQLGKVTQRELNDLAVGAFVPVNDILKIMQEQTGLTGDAFDDFRQTGEGVNAFMKAFATIVDQRATGSAQAMARTFKGASDNAKEFIKSLFGLNVVTPILDKLGGNIADFVAAFTSGDRWEGMTAATQRIGETLADIVSHIFNLGGGAEAMADRFLGAVEGVAQWLEDNQGAIEQWLQDGIAWVNTVAIPKILEFKDILFGADGKEGAIQKFGNWARDTLFPFLQQQILPVLQDISDLIFGEKEPSDLATSINEINGTPLQNVLATIMALKPLLAPLEELFWAIADVIIVAFGGEEPQTFAEFITNTVVPAIQNLTLWIENNREGLANLVKAFALMSIIGTVIGLVVSLAISLAILLAKFSLMLGITAIIAVVVFAFNLLKNQFEMVANIIGILIINLITRFTNFKNNVSQTISDVVSAFQNRDWAGIGRAIIDGIIRGFQNSVNQLLWTVTSITQQVVSTFQSNLMIHSPSALFEGFGENTMQGYINGIRQMIGKVQSAVSSATNATVSVAAQAPAKLASVMAPGTVSNNTTNNYNLQVNTSASSEPIIQDFNMLESLAA